MDDESKKSEASRHSVQISLADAQERVIDETQNLFEDEDDVDEIRDIEIDRKTLLELLDQIVERCKSAKIDCEYVKNISGNVLSINMPAGRSKRVIYVANIEQARALLEANFEKYVFVGDYNAICSYSDGYIEAALGNLGPASMGLFRARSRIFGARFDSDPHEHSIEIPTTDSESDLKIKLHLASQRLQLFDPGRFRRLEPARFPAVRLCLTIEGLKVRTRACSR